MSSANQRHLEPRAVLLSIRPTGTPLAASSAVCWPRLPIPYAPCDRARQRLSHIIPCVHAATNALPTLHPTMPRCADEIVRCIRTVRLLPHGAVAIVRTAASARCYHNRRGTLRTCAGDNGGSFPWCASTARCGRRAAPPVGRPHAIDPGRGRLAANLIQTSPSSLHTDIGFFVEFFFTNNIDMQKSQHATCTVDMQKYHNKQHVQYCMHVDM